jgi:predicted Zn-dependent protease
MEDLLFPDRHHVQAAEGWLELGDDQEAERELARLSREGSRHPSVMDIRWRIQSARSAWDKALEIARLHVESAPDHPAGWIHQSYTLHELRRTQEAMELLQSVATLFPEESVIPYNLACYCCQLGRLEAAQDWIEGAVGIAGKANIKRMAEDDPDLEPLRKYIEAL